MAETEKGRANHLTGADSTPFVASHLPKFLIANLELEFNLNDTKQSLLRISNRKYFAIFSLALPRVSPGTEAEPRNPNSNIRAIRILTNSRNITTYAFSNRNKIHLSPFACRPAFLLAKAHPAI